MLIPSRRYSKILLMASVSIPSDPMLVSSPALPPLEVIFGITLAMHEIRLLIERAATTDIPILISGETGTGKELFAKLLHLNSRRSGAAFVKVNCPAIPGALMESELFGYEKGAFTGAYCSKPGRVEAADKGTLFLDGIGDMDYTMQAKLLQVLQDGKFCRVGADVDRCVEVRLISATNHDLQQSVASGAFRADLFYRLHGISILLPSLRERRADIPVLIECFIEHYNKCFHRRTAQLSTSVVSALQNCSWPGNIRELENVIRRYVIFGKESTLMAELNPRTPAVSYPEISLEGDLSLKRITRETVRELERALITRVLESTHGNRMKAARLLKISYRALMYKIRDNKISSLRADGGVKPAEFESSSDPAAPLPT